MKARLIAAMIAFAGSPASADSPASVDDIMRSDTWLEFCGAELGPGNVVRPAACVGYIHGFIGAAILDAALPDEVDLIKCIPRDLTNQQIRAVWVKYLKDHPEKHHLQPYVTLWSALTAAFPCP